MTESEQQEARPGEDQPGEPPKKKKRTRIFRWEGIVPFLVVLALLGWGWVLFADKIVQDSLSEGATKALGTEVDVRNLDLDIRQTSIRIARLEIADPFDRYRNLVDAGPIFIDLERDPLLEKKIVIRSLRIENVKRGTKRETPAEPASRSSYVAQTLLELNRFTSQFNIPVLQLLPLDTIRALVLDPRQLGTVQAATRLAATADSVRDAVRLAVDTLRIPATVDSAQVLYEKLRSASPRQLGIAGTRQLIEETRATLRSLDAAKRRLEAVKSGVELGANTLRDGVQDIDSARKADYAFARGLLKLPTFEGPEIGKALFGEPSLSRFEQAVYYAKLAEKYMPPGLRPRPQTGPERLRASGVTVRYPRPQELPSFLLRRGDIDLAIADPSGKLAKYTLAVADLTTDPALLGRPLRFAARRSAEGSAVASLRLAGVSNHTGAVVRDSVAMVAQGVKLPGFTLPGLPVRLEPGAGVTGLTFTMRGDQVRARWELAARNVTWLTDTASAQGQNLIKSLVTRALVGIPELTLAADLSGTMQKPSFHVSSNLDEVIRERIRAIFGEELAKAEARARAAVDRIVAQKSAEVKQKADSIATEAEARVAEAQERLEEYRTRLDERVKELTRGLAELPKLPDVKLPTIPRP
jgi:uncharacterized protein (TIGR03545 family)